jgi:hypothetical protein
LYRTLGKPVLMRLSLVRKPVRRQCANFLFSDTVSTCSLCFRKMDSEIIDLLLLMILFLYCFFNVSREGFGLCFFHGSDVVLWCVS